MHAHPNGKVGDHTHTGNKGVIPLGWGLLAGLMLLAGNSPQAVPPAGCSGATLAQEGSFWWVQEVTTGDAGAAPVLILGCVQPPSCDSPEDGDDDDSESRAGAGGGDSPLGEGEDIGSIGRFRTLAAWDPVLADALACAAPILMDLPGGVLVCWDQGTGTLCARAFRVTAWAGDLPAAGELSEPVCVVFAGPADRAQAEADLLAQFAGNADDD